MAREACLHQGASSCAAVYFLAAGPVEVVGGLLRLVRLFKDETGAVWSPGGSACGTFSCCSSNGELVFIGGNGMTIVGSWKISETVGIARKVVSGRFWVMAIGKLMMYGVFGMR